MVELPDFAQTISLHGALDSLSSHSAYHITAVMAAKLDSQTLGLVFQSRPDILKGIQEAASVFLFSATRLDSHLTVRDKSSTTALSVLAG